MSNNQKTILIKIVIKNNKNLKKDSKDLKVFCRDVAKLRKIINQVQQNQVEFLMKIIHFFKGKIL